MAQVARGFSRAALVLLLLLGLLGAAAFGGQRWLAARLGPVDPAAQELIWVEIPSGVTTADVANLLFEQGLIKDPTVFRYYVRYRQLDAKLLSGEYQLSPSMTPELILQHLTQGSVRVHRFTVPEGLTIAMMADLLAEKRVMTREQFLAAARALAAGNPHLPEGVELAEPMEGYLFPATYEYRQSATPEEIVRMMFDRFEQVWTEELKQRARELNLTIHQVVTLASIVETEARVAQERPAIAGVYLNRLEVEMPLQADPTVYYALGLPRGEQLLYSHLEVDSPYNTYRYGGLPPGPIAAPGEDSIRAVLFPEEHDYYYFVAKADGTGEHYFGRTLDEHNENVARAEANARK
ncbi:MAG: endolytic transglycosylase MltG [Bacillota bacterium]